MSRSARRTGPGIPATLVQPPARGPRPANAPRAHTFQTDPRRAPRSTARRQALRDEQAHR